MQAYWQDFPPVHVLLHMITEGLAGKRIGAESPSPKPGATSGAFVPTSPEVLLKEMGESG